MSRFTKLSGLFNRTRRAKPPVRRVPMLEPLEPRLLLSTTLFLDFGAGIGMGNFFDSTPTAVRDVFGSNTGTDLTNNGLPNLTDTVRFAPLNYDFNLDSVIDNSDITALANAVLPLAQRALEPFDIDIVFGSAASLADAVTAVGANAGDAAGEFDA
jgi:hypothetical protein